MSVKEAIVMLFKEGYSIFAILLVVLIICPIAIIYPNTKEVCAVFSFSLLFTAYDLVGYKYAINSGDVTKTQLAGYRIIQVMFQIVLTLLVLLLTNYRVAIAVSIIHWTGFNDILYYLMGKYDFPSIWRWLHWTPLGIIKGDISNKECFIQAVIGLTIGIGLVLCY